MLVQMNTETNTIKVGNRENIEKNEFIKEEQKNNKDLLDLGVHLRDKNHPYPDEAYTELKALYANIYLELLERKIPLILGFYYGSSKGKGHTAVQYNNKSF